MPTMTRTSLTVTETIVEGLAALWVDTGPLALTVIPALGAKIASLRDTRSGREWLWRHPRLPYRRLPHGSSYVREADTGGWDECFPSVSACAYPAPPWAGAPIQDHGELWSQPAELRVERTGDGVTLEATWQGVALPYRFSRAMHLAAGSARMALTYHVASLADAPMPFIWSAHPLIAIEPAMALHVPPDARFHCELARPDGLLPARSGLPFPPPATLHGAPLNLARLPGPEAAVAIKLWSEPLAEGWARIAASDGALHLRWDVAELPQLALWLNLGNDAADGGAPYYNLGLEPCIGAQDSLAEAVMVYRRHATLAARGSKAWRLEVELEQ